MPVSLVTGGAGFIGAHVTHELVKLGHRVVVIDDLSGGCRDHVHREAAFIEGSVCDAPLLSALFDQHGFDFVFHLAAYAAEGLSHFIRRFNYTNNVIGSMSLVNEAIKHDVKCFVFTSSIAVYGNQLPPLHEDMVPQPIDPYGIAKAAVEQDLRAAYDVFGLNYIVLRPHNVYGEYQNIGDRYRNVVGIFMNQLLHGRALTVFGDGLQTRAFTYIGDVAPHIARSVHVPRAYNQTINIGADECRTINDVAGLAMEAMGVQGEIRHLAPRHEVRHAFASHSKAQALFAIQSSTPLRDGLRRMALWARQAGPRKSRRFGPIEITKGLPPNWSDA